MPLFEYLLVALIGAGGVPAAKPMTNLGPEAVVQPNGGALFAAPDPASKDKKLTKPLKHRRHRKHRHAALTLAAITVKQKSK
jgi:hypothetical protein